MLYFIFSVIYYLNVSSSSLINSVGEERANFTGIKCVLCAALGASAWERLDYLSLVLRKPAFCICESKDAGQLRGNCEADQHICFCNTDSTIPILQNMK